jgi:hypothetical protein
VIERKTALTGCISSVVGGFASAVGASARPSVSSQSSTRITRFPRVLALPSPCSPSAFSLVRPRLVRAEPRPSMPLWETLGRRQGQQQLSAAEQQTAWLSELHGNSALLNGQVRQRRSGHSF